MGRNPASLSAAGVRRERQVVTQLEDPSWHSKLERDWEVVVNTVSAASRDPEGYRASYIEGNRNLLEWCRQRSVQTFIYTSATSVYPQSHGDWVTEEEVPASGLSRNGCLLREAEEVVLENSTASATWIFRLAGIYGPGRHLYLDRLREGVREFAGDGSAILNLIHRDDAVKALLLATAFRGLSGSAILNLSDNHPTPKGEILGWLAGQLGISGARFNPEIEGIRSRGRSVSGNLPNRKVSNQKVRSFLGWFPQYASYREGYQALLL